VKSLQVSRVSIPNATSSSIPDDECVFWYYRIPSVPSQLLPNFKYPTPGILSSSYLYYVRLLPSYYKKELIDFTYADDYGYNSVFPDYESLATELSKACLADLSYDNQSFGDPVTNFIPGDISITYDSAANRFVMTGNNGNPTSGEPEFFYISAGYNDKNIFEGALPEAESLQISTKINDFPTIYNGEGQPFKLYKTLNQRLGFTWDGNGNTVPAQNIIGAVSSSYFSLLNRFRPIPAYSAGLSSLPGNPNVSYPLQATGYTAEFPACLVYTSIVNLYADIAGGSTSDSGEKGQALLATVPMASGTLGVVFYNPTIYNALTKISDQIYQIKIEMRTENGNLFYLPNSAIVTLEFTLTY